MNDFQKECLNQLNQFSILEYGEEFRFNGDFKKIPIMYTIYEDMTENQELIELQEKYNITDIQVQVFINLIEPCSIWVEFNGFEIYQESYPNNQFLEHLKSLDFDAWTSLDDISKYIEELEKESRKK